MALSSAKPILQFYLPCDEQAFERLPRDLSDYWSWQTTSLDVSPLWGRYHWVLQTYLHLRHAGLDVKLVRELPTSGIVLSHIDCLEYGLRPLRSRYLVVLLVDREVPHPYASLHITHNPKQRLPLGLDQVYLPPWPQIGLKERSPERGDRFETVAFVGYPQNLHRELASQAFSDRLAAIGLRLVMPAPDHWHDFSDIDAVIAIRSFGRSQCHRNKPGLKLYNAWLAKVPAIMGYEEAYRIEGAPGVDYLEAVSAEDALNSLQRLRDEPSLRADIVNRGTVAVREFSESAAVERWTRLFDEVFFPGYRRWSSGPGPALRCRAAGAFRERFLWRIPGWF